ncbi:zinc knuckle-domain-containing protein [Xylariaceae sp. FL0662B]|nr:zinc knuckle-domain-containing protein [Xylariaceae sp. FL0662B]
MYRRGPSKATPASVQCQKCLKRGHYSYECKVSTQDRPYIPRPSRTQQLLNPRLVPKLTSDVLDNSQNKKDVAEEELAKREAERAKKRELELNDDASDDGPPKRMRSASYDSVSTISTKRSVSPPARRSSRSPPGVASQTFRSPSPVVRASRRQSYDSISDYERRYSPSPPPRRARNDSPHVGLGRRARSPPRDVSPVDSRYGGRGEPSDRGSARGRRGRYSSSPSQSPPRENRRRFRSRSPDRPRRRGRSPQRYDDNRSTRGPVSSRVDDRESRLPARREQRERSLSPFSKRRALTQAMNMGR